MTTKSHPLLHHHRRPRALIRSVLRGLEVFGLMPTGDVLRRRVVAAESWSEMIAPRRLRARTRRQHLQEQMWIENERASLCLVEMWIGEDYGMNPCEGEWQMNTIRLRNISRKLRNLS